MPEVDRLRIGVLGPVVAELEGAPIALGTTRQRALLARFALDAGRVVSLDAILDALWADDVPQRAEVSVRSYVSNLRQVLEPGRAKRAPAEVLVTEGAGYVLRVDEGAVDALAFERDARRAGEAERHGDPGGALAAGEAAWALWRGPALADLAGVPFATGAATRLELERMRVELIRLRALVDTGRSADALDGLLARVEENRGDEAATAALMRALYQLGRPTEALEQATLLRGYLDDRGLLPSPALQDLEGAVLRHDPQLLPVAPPPTRSATADAPPARIVGRDDAWRALAAAPDRTGGRVAWSVLAGEAGIGKTYLAEAFADAFAGTVVWGRARRDDDQPAFWLWRSVLADLGADPGGEVVPDAVVERLVSAAREVPLLVVLDDVQWADSASLLLLARVATEVRRAALSFVLTVRPSPEPSAVDAALGEVLRQPGAQRLALPPLDDAAVHALGHAAGLELDEPTASALRERTAGNPLLVSEVLRTPRDAWRARLPADIAAVVAARLDPLPDGTTELLQLAALAGDVIEPELLARVAELPVADVLTALEPARRAAIVTDEPLRFRHVALRDVVLSSMGAGERRAGHARLAAALHEPWPRARRVHHLAVARPLVGAEELADAVAGAAAEAERLGAFAEQARVLEIALADDGLADDRRLPLTIAAGEARTRAGDDVDAQAHVADALDLAEARGETDAAAAAVRVLVRGGGAWYWVPFLQHPVDMLARLERAASLAPEGHPAEGLFLAALAVGEAYGPEPGRPAALAARALELARAGGDDLTLGEALVAASWAGFGVAPPADLLALADELVALGPQLPPERRALTHAFRLAAALRLGDLEGASAALAAGETEARSQRLPAFAATFGWARATVLAVRGDLVAAEDAAADAYVRHQRTQVYAADLARQLVALHIAEQRGAIGAAAAEADELAVMDDHAFLYQALARDPRVSLDADELGPRLAAVLDEAPAWHRVVRLTRVGLLASRLGSAPLVERTEHELAPYADEVVVAGTALACAGPVRRVLAALARAAGRPDDAVDHARTALAATDAAGLRGWAAPLHLELARSLHAAGAGRDAAEAAATAVDLAARMGQAGVADAAARLRGPSPTEDDEPQERAPRIASAEP